MIQLKWTDIHLNQKICHEWQRRRRRRRWRPLRSNQKRKKEWRRCRSNHEQFSITSQSINRADEAFLASSPRTVRRENGLRTTCVYCVTEICNFYLSPSSRFYRFNHHLHLSFTASAAHFRAFKWLKESVCCFFVFFFCSKLFFLFSNLEFILLFSDVQMCFFSFLFLLFIVLSKQTKYKRLRSFSFLKNL